MYRLATWLRAIVAQTANHIAPFVDVRAWVLIAGCALIYLTLVDPAMFKAVAAWVPQWLIFPALLVMVSRYILPDIVLGKLMLEVDRGNVAAAIVVASIPVFIGLGLISAAIWGRVL